MTQALPRTVRRTTPLRRILWPAVGQPVFRQWWFPARLRPAVLRAFGARLDGRVVIRNGVRVRQPWRLRVDGPAWLAHGATVTGGVDVTLERDVCVCRDAVLGSPGSAGAPIVLRRGAWIAEGATVLPGSEIGVHAVVDAGAVVSGVVASGVVASGVVASGVVASGVVASGVPVPGPREGSAPLRAVAG